MDGRLEQDISLLFSRRSQWMNKKIYSLRQLTFSQIEDDCRLGAIEEVESLTYI